mgnify:FL=1
MGKLIAINISEKRGTEKKEIREAELITDFGIAGDAHAGKWHRQVSLLSFEKIEDFKARGAEIENGAFGENLIVSGFDFKTLPVGTRFQIGDALLEMTQIGKQCHSHCAIYQRMGECIMPKEGVFAVVLKGGTIKKGDEVTMIPANLYATVRNRSKSGDTLVATVIDGKNRGEKLCMIDGKIRAVQSSRTKMYTDLQKKDADEEKKGTISGPDFFNEKYAEEIWQAHLAGKHRITIEDQEIFLHAIGNRARLVICGGGHVSAALVRMAKLLDFEIWVLEDRPFFAEHAKQEGADHILCGDYVESLAKIPKDMDHYYVCMTRGHRFDLECLREIYKGNFAYVGMMGSRKRSVLVRKELTGDGYSEEQVQRLHSPIGLSIGAQTPAEIALSVISEIVQCKNERAKAAETDEAILAELAEPPKLSEFSFGDNPEPEYRMLCTIIEKRGSAPRSIGTQMLVTSDNRIIGTIGGGCAEAEVITRCREHFAEMRKGVHGICETVKIQMTTDNAEEEGMVCGGRIEVLLESQ